MPPVDTNKGLLPGTKFYSPFPFGGMNQQDSPIAIDDSEFTLIENFIRLGKGNFRTAWDKGAAPYTAAMGRTIVSFYFYTLGMNYYVVVFLDDGSAIQVNANTAATTTIGGAGTFYNSLNGNLPAVSQWGTQYLLIANTNTSNDYWVWDGSLLYASGGAAPDGVTILSNGSGYTSTPTVNAFGGHGSGMVLVPTVEGGGVVQLAITNPGTGYEVGDVVQAAFSGGGSDDSAILRAILSSGTVAAASITAGGSGYATPPTIAFSGGGGSGAAATATVVAGVVTAITITNPGTGYTSAPAIGFSGGSGTGASAVAILSPAGVGSVQVINGGGGFLYPPNINFVGGGGTGASGVVYLSSTSIAAINITSGGQNYQTAPTVVFNNGGSGTGATATAVIQGGQVVQIILTNGGSGYGGNIEVLIETASGDTGSGATASAVFVPSSIDHVVMSSAGSGYTDAPAIKIQPGANRSAYADIELMPFGISGDAMETFQQRVWILNQKPESWVVNPPTGNFAVSAPGSLTDFSTSGGGVLFTNSDRFLQTKYTNVRQSNGYLYFQGDGSVSVVSNVTTSSAAVTTFNYQNVDPQVGESWRDSLQDFGRTIIFGNETGIYGLYGGSVNKISGKLDQLFTNAKFPSMGGITPTAAVATLFNVKHYMMLMTIKDPETDAYVNKMVTWNEREWSLTSQSVNLTYIGSQKVSSKLYAWGTDGSKLYPLFDAASTTLTKRLETKQYGAPNSFMIKQMDSLYVVAQDKSGAGISITAEYVASGLAVQKEGFEQVQDGVAVPVDAHQPTFSTTLSSAPYWPLYGALQGDFPFIHCAARITSTSADFVLSNLVMSYQEIQAYR